MLKQLIYNKLISHRGPNHLKDLKINANLFWRLFPGRLHNQSIVYASSQSDNTFNPKINKNIRLENFPSDKIRNFSIIAHVDHGKSTLADRLMEITGVISQEQKNEQVLDKLQVERERGITVKAQTASLFYDYKGEQYLINLVDTPGHVDFNYEVSRSLAACQGVVLLVDANQGIQAQTMANFFLAFEADLVIIPVMNKIDLKVAKPEEVLLQLQNVFDIEQDSVLKISAKNGTGVKEVLDAVIEQIPPPTAYRDKDLQMLLFDSSYDTYRGVTAEIALKHGAIKKGDKITSKHSQKSFEVQEVGIMHPLETPVTALYAGQVGYMYANMKKAEDAQIGDTFHIAGKPVESLPGFREAKPMVFAGIFPMDQSEYPALATAMKKLLLNDGSVSVNVDSSVALGQGWRLGFLGLLHMDVFSQRLEQEHNASVIVTTPSVPYKVKISGAKNIKKYKTDIVTILNPAVMPEPFIIEEYYEPMVVGTIIAPDIYVGEIASLIRERRGEQNEQVYIDNTRVMFKATMPLNEIVIDFFDHLKSITSGYASFDYEENGYEATILTRVFILLNGKCIDELTQLVHSTSATKMAKHMVMKLKASIPPQQYAVQITAKIGSIETRKNAAREDIKALRKDVTAKCYGGDLTRKMKLLKNQAEGKKRMKLIGNIEVPRDAFIKVLQR